MHVQNKESVPLSLVPEVGNLKYRALRESVHLGRVHLERVDCIKNTNNRATIHMAATILIVFSMSALL